MCDRLERKGLIRRRAARQDRREVRVSLSAAGQELVSQVADRRRAEIAQLLDRIPVEDQARMVELFGALADAAGEVADRQLVEDWEL
jgi:DNA-binding MarR family transcriptional regulator